MSTTPAITWHAHLPIRPISAKNSRRIVTNQRTGRPMLIASPAYATFKDELGLLLASQRPPEPISGPITLSVHILCKGKLDLDLDNAVAGISDVLQHTGIIANDRDVAVLFATKEGGFSDWRIDVQIERHDGTVTDAVAAMEG